MHPTQYGFREVRNTNNAIMDVVEFAYEAMDNGQMAAILFLKFSKAFDTVSHQKLIAIMSEIGINGRPLELFKSYLSNRHQRVKVENVLSSEMTIGQFSTPQGTVLSPVLYNIYVHQVYNMVVKGHLVSYADDTALCVSGSSWAEVFTNMKNDLLLLKSWFTTQNLFLNINKTKILPLTITKQTLPQELSLAIHEENCNTPGICSCSHIDIVSSFKYLGVELDHHLRWDTHIYSLSKRMRYMIYTFRILKTFLPIKTLKEVYFCLCQSLFEYLRNMWVW